jgi:hypothetical protein
MIMLVRGLAAALALAACVAGNSAFAETRSVAGANLVLTLMQPDDTVITSGAHSDGQVRFSMDGDTSCLSITSAGDEVVASNAGCSGSSGRLTIDVPRGMKLTISSEGSGDIRFADDIYGPLNMTLNGSGDVVGRKVMGPVVLTDQGHNDVSLGDVAGEVVLQMSGSGDVRLSGIAGALTLKHEGAGDLAVGHIEADRVSIDSTGSGDMLFGRGSIRLLIAHLQGNGDLGVAAEVQNGDVRAYGGGDVKLGHVTGTLTKSNGDGSDIYVGGPAIIDTIVGQIAKETADASKIEVHTGHGGGVHFLMLVVLAIAAFILWRILRRPGGFSGSRRAEPAAPTNPGVLAVCEKMSRLEQRLGRVESYVTSREFDLQQKFRNL